MLKDINIELTNDDLKYKPGEEEKLLARLEQKMKKSKEEIKTPIESVSSNRGKAS